MRKKFTWVVFLIIILQPNKANTQTRFQKTIDVVGSPFGASMDQTSDGGYIIGSNVINDSTGFLDFGMIKIDSTGVIQWTKTLGGSSDDNYAFARQTYDGGFILGGESNSFGAGGSDIYLIKTDASGDTIWTRCYGGSNDEVLINGIQTVDSGYIVVGATGSFGAGSDDVYLIKTDDHGDTLWTKTYGGIAADNGACVIETSDSGYLVLGDSYSFSGTSFSQIYLIKTDSIGNMVWSKTYGGPGQGWDHGLSIIPTYDGNYIICGFTFNFGASAPDPYVIKINNQGDTLWSRTYGSAYGDGTYEIKETADSGYILVGAITTSGPENGDVYLLKIDRNGNFNWSKLYGGSAADQGFSVCQTQNGGYMVLGKTLSFGTGPDNLYLIRTDQNGFTDCNEAVPIDSMRTPPTGVFLPSTIVSSTNTIVTTTTTLEGSGGSATTLCSNVDVGELFNFPFIIWPNPSSGNFRITFNYEIENGKIRIFDNLGKNVFNSSINSNETEINLKNLSSGIYFLKLSDGFKEYSKKVVIEN